jgi:hypothetical protein
MSRLGKTLFLEIVARESEQRGKERETVDIGHVGLIQR